MSNVIEIDLIGLRNAASRIGVHRTLLYYYIKENKIPVYNIDGHFFIDEITLEEISKIIRRKKIGTRKNSRN